MVKTKGNVVSTITIPLYVMETMKWKKWDKLDVVAVRTEGKYTHVILRKEEDTPSGD